MMKEQREREERLLRAIGDIDDRFILEADDSQPTPTHIFPKRKTSHWKSVALMAACFCFCFAAWVGFIEPMFHAKSAPMENKACADEAAPEAAEAEEGCDDAVLAEKEEIKQENPALGVTNEKAETFDSYTGLVLPLTARSDTQGIDVRRSVTADLSKEPDDNGFDRAKVRDSYTLTNTTDSDKTLELYYPYLTGTLRQEEVEHWPTLTVDDRQVNAQIVAGAYTGTFRDEGMNLQEPMNFEEYESLLADGSYLEQAIAGRTVPNLPVTLYTFQNVTFDGELPRAATLTMEFTAPEDATIFNFNMNGVEIDGEKRVYSIFTDEFDRTPAFSHGIVVLGQEPLDVTVNGYVDGSCQQKLSGLTAQVEATQTTLSEVLRQAAQEYSGEYPADSLVTPSMLYEAMADLLQYTPMGQRPTSRYDLLDLCELVHDAVASSRVLYQRVNVTVPAHSDVTVTAQSTVRTSSNFYCGAPEDGLRRGLDLAATAGSSLNFQSITARVILGEGQTLEGNFDPSIAEREVPLSLEEPCYRLVITE